MSIKNYFRCTSFNTKRKLPESDCAKTFKRTRSMNDCPNKNEPLDTYVNDIGTVENFWEIGNYKHTVERCNNGHKLCNELIEMITERAKIEETYAKSLQQWHKKWTGHLRNKSSEYETGKDSWQALLNTGNLTADIHISTSKSLINELVKEVKDWLNKTYERKYLSFKITRELEQEFREAEQKWVEMNEKLCKYKKNHNATIKKQNSIKKSIDSSKYDLKKKDKLEKLETKFESTKIDVSSHLDRHKQIKDDMKSYKPVHVKKMSRVFDMAQEIEAKRKFFFKEIFLKYDTIFQKQYHSDKLVEIFEDYIDRVNKTDPNRDLEWFSYHYGTNTEPKWSFLEENIDT